jgi:molybdopterin/thiamine biosynthesis adenylyltransferase
MESRYVRQQMLPSFGVEAQEKLSEAKVLLVGVGGLGSPIALYLAAAGVGRLGLVDADVVSESNLQRQVLYAESEVGCLKVECAQRRLSALNSQIRMDVYPSRFTEENAVSLLSRYDIIVDGCDNYETRYLMDEVSCCRGKPYIYGSVGEFRGQVSVFNYKGGARYSDLFPKEGVSDNKELKGVLGPVPGVVGTLEAIECIKVATGVGDSLTGRLLSIDLFTMEMTEFSI